MHTVFLYDDFAILSRYSEYYDNHDKETTNKEVQQDDFNEYDYDSNEYDYDSCEEDMKRHHDENNYGNPPGTYEDSKTTSD